MSEAPASHTSKLMGETIDVHKRWRWINEIERYTMPNCLFCPMCYESMPCDVFLSLFKDNTPSVVCASRMSSGQYELCAAQAALEQERSIRASDEDILSDLGVNRSSIGGRFEEFLRSARERAEQFLSGRTGLPASALHRAGEQFTAGFKAAVAQEAGGFVDAVQWAQSAAQQAPPRPDESTVESIRRKWLLRDTVLTADVIKRRFAQLASIAHPDHGGSASEMAALVGDRDILLASL